MQLVAGRVGGAAGRLAMGGGAAFERGGTVPLIAA